MKNYLGGILRILFVGVIVLGAIFTPQYSASAAPVLTVQPITWNVIGLDSNNVNVGPNDFPVGVRVCNTGDQPAANVVATFVWDSTNAYVELRPGSLNQITEPSLAIGSCFDYRVG